MNRAFLLIARGRDVARIQALRRAAKERHAMITTGAEQVQIPAGTDIESADGEHLGSIKDIQLNHYLIERGIIFKHDLYIPKTSVASFDGHTARLALTKADIDAANWREPPMADAPPGMAAEALSTNPFNNDAALHTTLGISTPLEDRETVRIATTGLTSVDDQGIRPAMPTMPVETPATRPPASVHAPGEACVELDVGNLRPDAHQVRKSSPTTP